MHIVDEKVCSKKYGKEKSVMKGTLKWWDVLNENRRKKEELVKG